VSADALARSWRWLTLLALSAPLAVLFTWVHMPAGVLLACMLASIWIATRGAELAVPKTLFGWGQGLLGCLMAHSLQPDKLGVNGLGAVVAHWPVFIVATVLLIVASAALGWLLMVYKVMPGTTAVWGMAPGAASAMVVMAESYGADVRLVAFMQYTRVVLVTAVAALVARAAGGHLAVDANQVAWLAVPYPSHLAATVALVLAGTWAAQRFALPGGAMVIPLVVGSVLQVMGLHIELPPALLLLAYAAIGCSVGLRFTPDILQHALRALPKVLGAILVLMGVGLLIAVGLMVFTGLDPLSAYLATSPGGADSMAVIAATSAVETSFVMAMQLARFLMVLLAGPAVSKWVAGRGKSVF
jgi:membrane AbrB-like protein